MQEPIVIIGGGFGGTPIAKEIRRRDLADVVVLEKGMTLGEHASGRNSGVGHSGFNYPPETLKAKFCVDGNRLLREVCQQHNVPFEQCGTLVVAQNPEEERQLEKYLGYGEKAGVPGIRIIRGEELKEREPYARGTKALFAPTGFIVDSRALLEVLAQEARDLGAKYFLDTEVIDIERNRLVTQRGDFESSLIINCAGLQADSMAHTMGEGLEYKVLPVAGHYKKARNLHVYSMIYPVKNEKFPQLGVHVTKTTEGDVIAGPTATVSFSGREGYDKKATLRGLRELVREPAIRKWAVKSLIDPLTREEIFYNLRFALPVIGNMAFVRAIRRIYDGEVNPSDLEPYRTGIRAQAIDKEGNMIEDFRVVEGEFSVNILNMNSPGMTSSLAVAPYFVERYVVPRLK